MLSFQSVAKFVQNGVGPKSGVEYIGDPASDRRPPRVPEVHFAACDAEQIPGQIGVELEGIRDQGGRGRRNLARVDRIKVLGRRGRR